jgi:hypothetical protein
MPAMVSSFHLGVGLPVRMVLLLGSQNAKSENHEDILADKNDQLKKGCSHCDNPCRAAVGADHGVPHARGS